MQCNATKHYYNTICTSPLPSRYSFLSPVSSFPFPAPFILHSSLGVSLPSRTLPDSSLDILPMSPVLQMDLKVIQRLSWT